MTWNDLILGSLRLLGVAATGETLQASQAGDAQLSLNDLLESWSLERLLVYEIIRQTYAITPSLNPHTIGVGGTFNRTRPVKLEGVGLILTSATPNIEVPLEELTPQRYQQEALKDQTVTLPAKWYYEPATPLGKLWLSPIPTDANQLALYLWNVIAPITDFTLAIALPPNYPRAIRYNLALELAPEYNVEPSALIVQTAMDAKAAIKRINEQTLNLELRVDAALAGPRGGFNWRTGE